MYKDSGRVIQEKANVLWNVANTISGLYKPHEYGLVILPMAIIQNGSSLFTGDAGSGPSEIRRYLIENDWLDAIIQLPTDSFYNTGIATYVWLVTKSKPAARRGKVQLIDASACCEARRKSIGNKRNDITEAARQLIAKAYKARADEDYTAAVDGKALVAKSRVFEGSAFGYTKITVESPLLENGKTVLKKGKPVADAAKRDTENVPLGVDIKAYMVKEVLPYNKAAWIDPSKNKVGYEIPFTRTFYEYKSIESAAAIAKRIQQSEKTLMAGLKELFGK